jgi:hypothetical protein
MGSLLSAEIKQPKKNKKRVHSLAGWWNKKRNFYVGVPQEDSVGAQTQDVTMEDVDSENGDNLNDAKRHSSVTSSPTFDVTSEQSPADRTRQPWDSEEQATFLPLVKDHANLESTTPVELSGYTPERRSHVTMPFEPEDEPFLSRPVPFTRKSFSLGSLETMDSLVESYWDSDDSDRGELALAPHWTPFAEDGGYMDFSPDSFAEHVHFLRVQTRPHQVEEIWFLPNANHVEEWDEVPVPVTGHEVV